MILQQAIYGYHEGHRLLASSIPISGVAGRQLRGLTDASFDHPQQRFLTVAPIHELRSHAVIRTWPDPEGERPGSVWSHVLLIDHMELAAADRLGWLLELFRRPEPGSDHQAFELPLNSTGRRTSQPLRDAGQLAALADAVYGGFDDVVVQWERFYDVEATLMALWEQQWPRLRRSFSFRTRHRAAGSKAVRFDLQVVERLSRGQLAPEQHEPAPWLASLAADLVQPSPSLRSYLRDYGAEADRGRPDMRPLIEVYEAAQLGKQPRNTVNTLCRAYPSPEEMRGLKRALLGREERRAGVWELGERERLEQIVSAAEPDAFDLDDLHVANRLHQLWRDRRPDAMRLLALIDDERDDPVPAHKLVAESAFEHVAAGDVPALAAGNAALASRILSAREDLLQSPAIWLDPGARSLAGAVAADADRESRTRLFAALLENEEKAVKGLEALMTIEPPLWWLALESLASQGLNEPHAALARRLAATVGVAAVGSPPPTITTSAVALLAIATDPKDGLWRQIDANRWADASDLGEPNFRARILSIGLAATKAAGSAGVRRRLWTTAFGPLHSSLAADGLDGASWELLDSVLPHLGDDDWDRCRRLRAGVVGAIKRDRWPRDAVQEIVKAAGPDGSEIVAALTPKKKAKKGWLRDLVDHLLP
ncbi:MAG: hypothetical protein WKF96_10050 [Solirubrobacteraceae bacterium]